LFVSLLTLSRGYTKERSKIIHDLREAISMNPSGELIAEIGHVALITAQDLELAKECAEM
jgi:hypothetical protein